MTLQNIKSDIKEIIDLQGRSFQWVELEHKRWWEFWSDKKKYKYMLVENYSVGIGFGPKEAIHMPFFSLYANGHVLIKRGYVWDGASGPTIDTVSTIRASAVHDVLYQSIRISKLDYEHKNASDKELARIMKEDYHPKWFGARWWSNMRASYYYAAVWVAGGSSCVPGSGE